MLKKLLPLFMVLTLLGFVGYKVLERKPASEIAVKNLRNWQDADAPFGDPVEKDNPTTAPGFVPNLHLLSVFERLSIPVAHIVDSPLGSSHGAGTYNAQPFLADNAKRGGKHLADDLNGIGGEDSDFGMPVYAAADGRVEFVGIPAPGWGRVVILSHRTPLGELFQTMYAHLHKSEVFLGELVGRGEQLGTVGTAAGLYLAHLHFEIRRADGVVMNEKTPGYFSSALDRVDPEAFRRQYGHDEPSLLYRSPLEISQEPAEMEVNGFR